MGDGVCGWKKCWTRVTVRNGGGLGISCFSVRGFVRRFMVLEGGGEASFLAFG